MTRRFIATTAVALGISSAALFGTPAFADQVRDKQWHLDFLDITAAHKISTGKGVTVAVIDSGVADHPDLSGSVLKGTDYVNKGDDGKTDVNGHGTSMSGLIAAHGKNGNGALGIAPDAKILPVRVFEGGLTTLDFGPAVKWAVNKGVGVINLSVGGGINSGITDALDEAASADIVVVAAAGNKPDDFGVTAPAFIESVVAVGSVNREGRQAATSVSGPELDIAAPGADVESTGLNGTYKTAGGTSNSSAIVAGAAALIRSKYPDMTAPEVVDLLESTATDKGAPGVDDVYGHDILNIVAALNKGVPQEASPTTTAPAPSTAAPTANASGNDTAKEPASSNALLVGGAVLVALVGGLIAFLVARRRSRPTA